MTDRTLANGRYVLGDQPLAVGGMGTVWKAFDTVLQREVAVKELRIPDGLIPDERAKLRSRALREARAAAGLDHPAIVTIHDVVDDGERPWIVMRLLPGRTLDQAVRANGPLSPRRTAELGVRLLEGLAAAHANGVLHRDVKPQNVMLGGDERWMLTDFGIASVAGATRTLTGTGIVTGTLGYVAPERLSGAEPGAPADLWALGATLYFAVEGRHAYDFDDLPAMIGAVLTRDPDPVRLAGPLAPIIAGLMHRDPAHRLDARTAREQLLAVAGGYPTFENPTVVADHNRQTEKLRNGTKLMPPAGGPGPGTPGAAAHENADGSAGGGRVLRALGVLLFASNAALGGVLALLGNSVIYGMPLWILAALAVVCAAGAALGARLAPRLVRWIGLPAALSGAAVVTGEAIAGAGLVVNPRLPISTIVLVGLALLTFAICQRLSRAARGRVVPPELLKRVTMTFRLIGFAGFLFGALLAVIFFWGVYDHRIRLHDLNYVQVILTAGGAIVVVAALLTISAIRSARSAEDARPPGVLTSVLFVIPVVVAIVFGIGYVARMNDFTTLPDICGWDTLSEDQVRELTGGSPEADNDASDSWVDCDWKRVGDDDSAELEVELTKYEDVSSAKRTLQQSRETAAELGKTVAELSLGDESFSRPYDGSIDSEDTLGRSVYVRIENIVLEVALDQSESRGAPSTSDIESVADELTSKLENVQPHR
ncbi:protein kinase domain-containing protein [Kribbella sp. NPDC054772]